MALRSIKHVKNLKDKTVLVRVDYNVPMNKGKVLDDTRLRASVPTIQYLQQKGAKVVLAAHIGRPEGKWNKALSTKPLVKQLAKLLQCSVKHIPTLAGPSAFKHIKKMNSGDVALLENMRYSPEEKGNKGVFAASLAAMADLFVMDGFGVAHRADASVVGPALYIPAYAGLLIEKELKALDKLIKSPKKPLIAVIGGAKMETKLPVIETLAKKATKILVGGGIVNTILAAEGYDIGASIVEPDLYAKARELRKKKNLVMPIDLVIGKKNGKGAEVVDIGDKPHALCADNEAIFDIGPKTQALYEASITKAKTLMWNGAMGYMEQSPYDTGTNSVAISLANQSKAGAYTVIGGGETIESMEALSLTSDIDHVSTGGGAMLSYLAGEDLPGISIVS